MVPAPLSNKFLWGRPLSPKIAKRWLVGCAIALLLGSGPTAYAESLSDSYHWQNVRVGAGGFAPNILFSPVEPGLAYLRTDMGGAYRWEQKRGEWVPLQDAMAESSYQGIESIAPDPRDPDVVYVAAGMYRHYAQAAILRSADRGDTWQVAPVEFRMGGNEAGRGMGERLAVDPNDTRILYFGSRHDGLWRSADRGVNWSRVESFPHKGLGLPQPGQATNIGISFVVFDPTSGEEGKASQRLWAGVADAGEQHLFHSRDGGQTWAPVPGQPRADLLPAQAELDSRGMLYISYSNGPGPNEVTDGALFRLDTRTGEWTDISPERQKGKPAGGYMGLSIDRRQPGTLMVATMNRWRPRDTLWRSVDDGKSWQDIGARSRRDVSTTPFLYWGQEEPDFGWWIAGLAIDPFDSQHVAYTTGATIYRTRQLAGDDTAGILWRPWDQGVEQTAIITLASPPYGPLLLSGFGDISGFAHDDLSQSPSAMFTNPVFANTNTIDYAGQNPQIVVRSGTPAHRSEGEVPTLAWSEDYGRSWQPMPPPTSGLSMKDREQMRSGNTAVITTADGAHFILTTSTPHYTDNRGKSWHAVRGLPERARPVADRVLSSQLYAVDFEGEQPLIYLSRNGGRSFVPLPTKGLPENIQGDRPRSREAAWPLVTTPDRDGHLWFVSSHGLFHSSDGGREFKKIPTELQIQQISFGKAAPDGDYPTLFAIAWHRDQRGIWRSTDTGATWRQINGAEHQWGQRFRTLSGDPRVFGRVYVGTDGRGILYGEPRKSSD